MHPWLYVSTLKTVRQVFKVVSALRNHQEVLFLYDLLGTLYL